MHLVYFSGTESFEMKSHVEADWLVGEGSL